MSKKKIVNIYTGNRISVILEEKHLTNEQLAEIVDCSPISISRMKNNQQPVTQRTAKNIIKKYPEYRLEWLQGIDDYKTEDDYNNHFIKKAVDEGNLLLLGLNAFSVLSGYTIDCNIKNSGSVDDVFESLCKAYTITKDDKSVTLSIDEMNDFQNEMAEYVELRLRYLSKSKGVSFASIIQQEKVES